MRLSLSPSLYDIYNIHTITVVVDIIAPCEFMFIPIGLLMADIFWIGLPPAFAGFGAID